MRVASGAFVVGIACCLAASCGQDESTTGTSSGGNAGTDGGGTGGSAGTGASDAGVAQVSLPQFVRGAARVNVTAFPTIPIVVEVTGATADEVELSLDAKAPVAASFEAGRWVVDVDAAAMGEGPHELEISASAGGSEIGSASATLSVASESLGLTDFAKDGSGYSNHLVHDVAGDRLALSFISVTSGVHQLYLSYLDGAFQRLSPSDVVLNAPGDEPLSGRTAFGSDGIGVVYRVAKPGDVHWLVKMRVVDGQGNETVPTMDLTAGEAAFSQVQAGVDPGGYSAAWVHISPATDPRIRRRSSCVSPAGTPCRKNSWGPSPSIPISLRRPGASRERKAWSRSRKSASRATPRAVWSPTRATCTTRSFS